MKLKNVAKILLFLLLFVGLFAWLNQITTPDRTGDLPWDEFYSLPNDTLDIVILGSSKANHTYNPLIINEALGLDAYCLSAHGIGLDESYYALKEAFKTQSPKIVVLELYSAKPTGDKKNERAPLHRAYDAMHFSLNKARGILSKVPLDESLEYFIPFTINHSNWKTLSFKDMFRDKASGYTRYFGYYLVEYSIDQSEFITLPENYMVDTRTILPDDDTMATLARITALCQANDAQLVYVVSPGYGEDLFGYEDLHRLVNGLTPYAQAEGILIWDYHRLLVDGEMQYMDFTDSHHTNTLGADKVSRAFAEDIESAFADLLADYTQDWDIADMLASYEEEYKKLSDAQ
ncbi:MAG: hypothetical protein AB1Z19_09050 [Eubacteriales bacterium]